MEWTQKQKYALSAGAYQVSKTYTATKAVYTAWPPKPPYNRALPWQALVHQCIGCYSDAGQAKAACEAHAALSSLCSFLYRQSDSKNKPTAPC